MAEKTKTNSHKLNKRLINEILSSSAEKIVKLRDPFGVALSFGTCGDWTMMYHFRATPLENCIVVHRCGLSLSTLLSNRFRRRASQPLPRHMKYSSSSICLRLRLCLLLLFCGDIEVNPGPVRFPCGVCNKSVRSNQLGILLRYL